MQQGYKVNQYADNNTHERRNTSTTSSHKFNCSGLTSFTFHTFPVNCFYDKVFFISQFVYSRQSMFLVRNMLYHRDTGDRLVGDNAISLGSCVIRHSTYCALGQSIGGICTMTHCKFHNNGTVLRALIGRELWLIGIYDVEMT